MVCAIFNIQHTLVLYSNNKYGISVSGDSEQIFRSRYSIHWTPKLYIHNLSVHMETQMVLFIVFFFIYISIIICVCSVSWYYICKNHKSFFFEHIFIYSFLFSSHLFRWKPNTNSVFMFFSSSTFSPTTLTLFLFIKGISCC